MGLDTLYGQVNFRLKAPLEACQRGAGDQRFVSYLRVSTTKPARAPTKTKGKGG